MGRHPKVCLESGILLQDPHCPKGPALSQSSNYSSGRADGLAGRESSIAWEKQGKHPAGNNQLKPNPFVLHCALFGQMPRA